MREYLELVTRVLENGKESNNRTITDTISLFGEKVVFDVREGFPLVTTKYVNFNFVVGELLWFISDSRNTKDINSKIWDAWAVDGYLGPIYPGLHNQLPEIVDQITKNPNSRRLVVSNWDASNLPDESISPQENVKLGRPALAACHMFFQFNVSGKNLDIQVYQRSWDLFLGAPYNIASYALLLKIVAHCAFLKPRKLIYIAGDAHIYSNHIRQLEMQTEREPLKLSEVHLNPDIRDITLFTERDIELVDYRHQERIRGAIAI